MIRKRMLLGGMVAIAAPLPCFAAAQARPAKPIRLIVTYPPGGGADTVARLLSPIIGEALGQPVPSAPSAAMRSMFGVFMYGWSPAQHYHLPFKCTPWGYSCFRSGV